MVEEESRPLPPFCQPSQGACFANQQFYCQQNLPGEVGGPLCPRGAMDNAGLGSVGVVGQCFQNSFGYH